MSIDLRRRHVFAVLLDIEGTTTPAPFVREVLLPFARANLRSSIEARRETGEMQLAVRELAAEHAAERGGDRTLPPWHSSHLNETLSSAADYAEWLMDRGRTSPGLTRLQGLVWDQGYQAGELRGHVFEDLPQALYRWRASGTEIGIYSTASELAQHRLYESAAGGDLTPFITNYFDMATGLKGDPRSYARISEALRMRPAEVLFLSDLTVELAAARKSGLQVALSVRPGNLPQADAADFEQFTSFDEIVA